MALAIDPLGERYSLGPEIDGVLADMENGIFSSVARITNAEQTYSPRPKEGVWYRQGRYGDAYLPSSEAVDLVARTMQLVESPQKTLLEVGAGRGMWSSLLSRHFGSAVFVVATDTFPKPATIWPLKVIEQDAAEAVRAYQGAVVLSLFPQGRLLIDAVRTMKVGTLLLHSGPDSDYNKELEPVFGLLSEIDSAELFRERNGRNGQLFVHRLKLYRRIQDDSGQRGVSNIS
jgi:hypothetical protein